MTGVLTEGRDDKTRDGVTHLQAEDRQPPSEAREGQGRTPL